MTFPTPFRRFIAVLVVYLLAAVCLAGQTPPLAVTSVKFWSLDGTTRVSIEMSGDFEISADRAEAPERVFFDFPGSRNGLVRQGVHTIPVGDKLVRRIRVAESSRTSTRVVLDLETKVEFTFSRMTGPHRLMVEIRPTAGPAEATPLPARAAVKQFVPPKPAPREARRFLILDFLPPAGGTAGVPARTLMTRVMGAVSFPPEPPAPKSAAVAAAPAKPAPAPPSETVAKRPVQAAAATAPAGQESTAPNASKRATPAAAAPARKTSSGRSSLTRTLGLKIRRIVIDPGHGGHDFGTTGPTGLHEKDLVLDIARRLGRLVEERLESEAVFTRSDDTFIPLEERTQIANQSRADLFLSIHANSSPIRSATGVETYYLSFTTSRTAMEVASRENASSSRSVFELRELLQKIALTDKVDESRELARQVQSSVHSTAARTSGASRNRGVKKAPFVVLIGASMPSVLTEIGFVSNSREESLLKRPEHRQKVAEAILKGIQQYASGLSHYQVAQRED